LLPAVPFPVAVSAFGTKVPWLGDAGTAGMQNAAMTMQAIIVTSLCNNQQCRLTAGSSFD
jgi:hypothetical protein